jgi:hypothetical protein
MLRPLRCLRSFAFSSLSLSLTAKQRKPEFTDEALKFHAI